MTASIDWNTIDLGGETDTSITVSNGSLVVPKGLEKIDNFITEEDASDLLSGFDRQSFTWAGFEQRRKVTRFKEEDLNGGGLPSGIENLVQKFIQQTGRKPTEVAVEEYPKNQLHKLLNTDKATVSTFEASTKFNYQEEKNDYFMAILPIYASAVEYINRPKIRKPDCWDLYSEQHCSGILLEKRCLYVKTDEYLFEWRSRISTLGPDERGDQPILFVKFYFLPPENLSETEQLEDSIFGYRPSEDLLDRPDKMPPIEDILTVIVTTSPIKSNPSTELLERVFDTFPNGGDSFAYKCRKIIVCDGCRQRDAKTTKKHNNFKQAMRNGIVNDDQYENYTQFKQNLSKLCESAQQDSAFWNTSVEELDTRHGYGFALRHALQECVSTPYVIVIQHDRTFMRPTPIEATLRAMWHNHHRIKYVGMSMRSNLLYRDQFGSKYGRSYMEAMKTCILRPPELQVDGTAYGPEGANLDNMDYGGQPRLRQNLEALVETYRSSMCHADHQEWLASNPIPSAKAQLSLTPTFFWYDNVHICETAHYRDFVFHPPYKMVVRGGFVEDKLSPVIKKAVERMGLVQGHARFGCYLLDDHSGMFFTGHLDGGSYITKDKRMVFQQRSSTGSSMSEDKL
ncbi:unnamed protein product [Cylindrotheca closterium]|uniref:Uncharacterized protein n=1 Tax=Cylindrotheca closterium TaxID=2856 RepID=A0AAD2PV07_9STRA|nr:unnamed protein product [Cylindrotheca closterium]